MCFLFLCVASSSSVFPLVHVLCSIVEVFFGLCPQTVLAWCVCECERACQCKGKCACLLVCTQQPPSFLSVGRIDWLPVCCVYVFGNCLLPPVSPLFPTQRCFCSQKRAWPFWCSQLPLCWYAAARRAGNSVVLCCLPFGLKCWCAFEVLPASFGPVGPLQFASTCTVRLPTRALCTGTICCLRCCTSSLRGEERVCPVCAVTLLMTNRSRWLGAFFSQARGPLIGPTKQWGATQHRATSKPMLRLAALQQILTAGHLGATLPLGMPFVPRAGMVSQ